MLGKEQKLYTIKDFMNLPENTRAEFWDGTIYNMSPAPNTKHQQISRELLTAISNYLKKKPCQVFHAPFDVFLLHDPSADIETAKYVVQPDISVICGKDKIIGQGCKGTPDFIIEIVSPSSKAMDYVKKLNLYNDYGVKEYWIVDPEKETIIVYVREDHTFTIPQKYDFNDTVAVSIFEDLLIDFTQFDVD